MHLGHGKAQHVIHE